MSNAPHILMVDDNPDDRALVSRELRKQFPGLAIREGADPEGFQRAMEDCPDLVITDYQVRWTDGLSVLRTVKERWPDCPVIMFTGTGSEEVAVQAMKMGLQDYVLKSPRHYARLPAAAALALKMSSQKRELCAAELRYTVLFETVPVGLYRASAEGRILDANPTMLAMLGYEDAESIRDMYLQDFHVDMEQYEQWRAALSSEGAAQHAEVELKRPDGRVCWAENHARAVVDETGALVYEGSLKDITGRKQTEAEREMLIAELQDALAELKTLSGLLPICSSCKKIRDGGGRWNQIEAYIQQHSDAEFTHSFCPDCLGKLYPEHCAAVSPASRA